MARGRTIYGLGILKARYHRAVFLMILLMLWDTCGILKMKTGCCVDV